MDQVIIGTTDNEQQNREFVRLTPKMQPPLGAFRFDYRGYWNCESHCTMEIHGNLVIVTEADDNQGTSITNMAEHLATRVCHQFQIDPLKLVWIEHYRERGHEWMHKPITESWDFVTFQQIAEAEDGAPRLMKPIWSRITPDKVKELIEARGEYQDTDLPV